jgi:hypothetical protein
MNTRAPTRSSNVERRRNAVPRCLRQLLYLEFRETQVGEACKVISVCVSATYTITVYDAIGVAVEYVSFPSAITGWTLGFLFV